MQAYRKYAYRGCHLAGYYYTFVSMCYQLYSVRPGLRVVRGCVVAEGQKQPMKCRDHALIGCFQPTGFLLQINAGVWWDHAKKKG